MLTTYQVFKDVQAALKSLERDRMNEDVRSAGSNSQHDAVFHKPQPFEFAKLEQWKPSKHRKR